MLGLTEIQIYRTTDNATLPESLWLLDSGSHEVGSASATSHTPAVAVQINQYYAVVE